MSFDIATLSRTAGRTANEDYADFLQTDAVGCWVIADGLGGHRGGATASKAVVEAALDSFRMTRDVSAEAVTTHIARAQEALLEARRREPTLSQMRSTIVVLISGDREAVWAHVGDSRLYHLRGGQVIARTRDHSVGQALVDGGQIDAAAQGSHEDRSRLLRCLGKEGEGGATVAGPQPLARGDVFLLCTDGFWEALDDVAMTLDLAASEDAAAWLQRLEARLRRRIGPSHDNYTATAIRVLNDAVTVPPPHDPRTPVDAATTLPAAARGADRTVARAAAQAPLRESHATRVSRGALAAAGVLLAIALAATGVWHRHAISAWVRSLMSPAAVTPAKDQPLERRPDAKPRDERETPPTAGAETGSGAGRKHDEDTPKKTSPASPTPDSQAPKKERAAAPRKPAAAKPEIAKPETAKPESGKPDAKKPDTKKPESATPDAPKSIGAPINEGKPRPRTPPRPPGDHR